MKVGEKREKKVVMVEEKCYNLKLVGEWLQREKHIAYIKIQKPRGKKWGNQLEEKYSRYDR